MSTSLSSAYANQDIVLHVGENPKDVEATNGEVHYTKNQVEPEVEIKIDQKKKLGILGLVRLFFYYFILFISSPCQRQRELLPSLGIRHPSSVVCRPLTFHILIFFSESPHHMN